ncbi:uncharacterized protein FTOL_07101 [Fusarium torulosum]|uniref:Uncharacterized protein n=1 Tax=Fusarium torulosum TaxID=33205 RepID=A0AAE8MBC2_9HYPO|nr:uncharacterized protein FTOL_07101 [Fusarium torulosum]
MAAFRSLVPYNYFPFSNLHYIPSSAGVQRERPQKVAHTTTYMSSFHETLAMFACRNIDKSVADTICLEPPGDENYASPRTSPPGITAPIAESSAVPVPSDISNGTAMNRAQYYREGAGHYCN